MTTTQEKLVKIDNAGMQYLAKEASIALIGIGLPSVAATITELGLRLEQAEAALATLKADAKVILRNEPDNLLREKLLVALSDV